MATRAPECNRVSGPKGHRTHFPRGYVMLREKGTAGRRLKKPPSRAMYSRSRRLDEFRVEMLQPRHHFLLQQPQRIVPGLGLVLVVEAEHQQRAETADLAVDGLDLLGYRRRRADDPVVAGAVFDRHVAVRYVGRVLEIVLEAEVTEQRQEIFTHHPAHHVAGGKLPGLLVGIG